MSQRDPSGRNLSASGELEEAGQDEDLAGNAPPPRASGAGDHGEVLKAGEQLKPLSLPNPTSDGAHPTLSYKDQVRSHANENRTLLVEAEAIVPEPIFALEATAVPTPPPAAAPAAITNAHVFQTVGDNGVPHPPPPIDPKNTLRSWSTATPAAANIPATYNDSATLNQHLGNNNQSSSVHNTVTTSTAPSSHYAATTSELENIRRAKCRKRRQNILAGCCCCVVAFFVLIMIAGLVGGDDEDAQTEREAFEAELLASDGARGDLFGHCVAVSPGGTIVVGAPFGSVNRFDTGSAYVFARDESSLWVQQTKLSSSDGASQDQFGGSIAIFGETVVVGAPFHNGTGAVYVFTLTNGNVWTQETKITSSDGVAGDRFGWSVSMDQDAIAVGAPTSADTIGSVYVFALSAVSSTWTERAKLGEGLAYDEFGFSIALDQGILVVGAPGTGLEGDFDKKGCAYVYARNGTTWSEPALQGKLTGTNSEEEADDEFGFSVAVDSEENIVVVGARHDDLGRVYTFVRTTEMQWAQQQQLKSRPISVGQSVAVDRVNLIAGAYGALISYQRTTGTSWLQNIELSAEGDYIASALSNFGENVALSGDTAVVGASGGNSDTGFVSVINLSKI